MTDTMDTMDYSASPDVDELETDPEPIDRAGDDRIL